MTSPSFVHLSLHTEYSLVDGLIRVEPVKAPRDDRRLQTLTQRAAELEFPAVAVTDLNNLFALVKFYKAAEGAGIKPITGAEVLVDGEPATRVTLLASNHTGYRNLVRIVSGVYTETSGHAQPAAQRESIGASAEGVIALCGPQSEIGAALLRGQIGEAEQLLAQWRQWFGDRLYLTVQRCGRAHDEVHTRAAVALARVHGVPLVATNDVRFLRREDFDVHEARVCINQGRALDDPRRPRDYTPEQYLKSADEMGALFADLPEALANSVEIARRCSLSLTFGVNHLPEFSVPDGHDAASWLRDCAHDGLGARLAAHPTAEPESVYRERLDYELSVIEGMGFPGYFLIVADFIRWAKANHVPVGPGRGSGAGSLVAYALGITDLDPIPHKLLFERFLNPERVSMPDFDVDFCMEGRDNVIDYVTKKYGHDHVGQIITYGSMAARAVVRDATRVLGHPHGLGDRIAKMIPGTPAYKVEAAENGCTELEYALRTVPELRMAAEEEDVKAIIDLGVLLEGLPRNVGRHAGGVVIAPGPLTDYAPLYKDASNDGVITQFDMKDLEAVGLVKFDFLGLRTLTIIQWAVDIINAGRRAEQRLDILDIPLDDPGTFALFARGETAAVFQMESAGMRRLAMDLKPGVFEDLVALVALFRPGPLQSGMVRDFIERKHGQQQVIYPHPALEQMLRETYGVIVYQEQVMRIARELAGYTLGEADLLRRAMGKKKPEEMAKQRQIFVEGAVARGTSAEPAGRIFDLMEKFAEYGFNKSHSAAYALVAYQTAWLKVHYPAAFMCAVLSAEMSRTETVVMMIDECARMRIPVVPPDVNRSQFKFTVTAEGTILYGLGAIRGVGRSAVDGITDARDAGGVFRDLFDFCRRIDTRRANKRVLETLIHAGALDALGPNRPTLLAQLPQALAYAEQAGNAADTGQEDLFGLQVPQAAGPAPELSEQPDWPDDQRLARERETLGFYLSGHPIEAYRGLVRQFCDGSLKELIAQCPDAPPPSDDVERRPFRRGPRVLAAGWLVDVRRFGKRGVLTLDDRTALVSVPLSEEQWARWSETLRKDALWFVRGRLSPDEYSGGHQIRADELFDLDGAYRRYAERLLLRWPRGRRLDVDALQAALEPMRAREGCTVGLRYINGQAAAEMALGEEWRVRPSESGLATLRRLLGDDGVELRYRAPVDDGRDS